MIKIINNLDNFILSELSDQIELNTDCDDNNIIIMFSTNFTYNFKISFYRWHITNDVSDKTVKFGNHVYQRGSLHFLKGSIDKETEIIIPLNGDIIFDIKIIELVKK